MTYYTVPNLRCPCMCRGEGEVSFVVCPHCDCLLFKCEEIDTLMDSEWREIIGRPQCGEPYACQFPHASAGRLEAAGLM